VKTFIAEYHREVNRQAAEHDVRRHRITRDLEKTEREVCRLIDAIKAGVPGAAIKDEMTTLEARRRDLLAQLQTTDGRLRRVLAYIEEHLAEEITVGDLANVACLSVFHFTRAFAATMGVPPHRYVSRRRLESAKAMIATGRASLGEIALDCQFSSQSSFTRAFRRATGMMPAEYRRTLR
jgi:AraC family transcriptional regulator